MASNNRVNGGITLKAQALSTNGSCFFVHHTEIANHETEKALRMKRAKKTMTMRLIIPFLILCLYLGGCAINPVTGKNEFALMSEAAEISAGSKQYLPSRQMQGGDYNVNQDVVQYVQRVGNRLAAVSDRQLPYEFNVINDSTPNAWALPGGKIAINRGLLTELNSEAELAAVLGHEIIHAAARHGAKGMERGALLQGAVLVAGMASQNSEYSGLAVGGAGIAAQLITTKYGRSAELESDLYGMKYMAKAGYDPRAAIDLQQTFVRLSEGQDTSWLNGLFASHPPSPERVEANRQTAATLPTGGEIGRERYLAAMAPLRNDHEAYQAHDSGRKALIDGDIDLALALAQKALKLQPREALFHSLRGDIRFKQQRYSDAITNYDRALEHNNNYFHYYLQRGLAKLELNQINQANSDLKKSLDLLPTAPALNALGQMALAQGDRSSAKSYFSSAAASNSTAGKQASRALIELDLPDNPHQYIQVKLLRDRYDSLQLQIFNTTPVAIEQTVITIQFTDQNGTARQVQQQLAQPLAGESGVTIATGIGPLNKLQNIRAQVSQAQIVKE